VKKFKYLLFASMLLLMFDSVSAKTYSKVFTDTATTCYESNCDIEAYNITISANGLDDVTMINAHSPREGSIFITDSHQIYAEQFYEYSLYSNAGKIQKDKVDIEIIVEDDDLKKGDVYNIYYFSDADEFGYNKKLDIVRLGQQVIVMQDANGTPYIKFTTDSLQAFALEKPVSDEFKAEFEKISENGFYTFPAIKPKQTIEDGFDFYSFFGIVAKRDLPYEIWPADEFKKENDYQYMTIKFDSLPNETHIVKYKWQENEVPQSFKKEIDAIEKNILNNTKPLSNFESSLNGIYFEVEDLNYLNYIVNDYNEYHDGIALYSSDLKSIFRYNNFKYYFDFRAGNVTPFYNHMFGYMLVEKNDLLYSMMFTAGIAVKPVIYIPDNTKDTDNDYINAALKRIKAYLEIDNISMTVGGKRTDFEVQYPELSTVWNRIYNEEKLSDNYYVLDIDGKKFNFLIEKNTKKAKDMEFKTKDLESDVEINTTSGLVPLDTSIQVDIIGKDHKEYQKILEALGRDNADIYDLKLFSESKEQYITKLPNGKFKVRIPLKDEYKNKELKVYYVDDNGNIETYEVIVDNGYAIFETNHFSTYSLVAEENISNPNTLDNISLYFMIGMISVIGMIGTAFMMKKDIVKN